MSAHQTEFHNRLARINAGAGYTKSTVYVGLDGVFTYVPKNKRRSGMSQTFGNASYVFSFSVSMVLGLVCHILERFIEFTLVGMPDPNANLDVQTVRVAVTGFAITVVASYLLGLRDKGLMLPKLLGVAGGILFLHNAVHRFPQEFERVFSPAWVAQIISTTEPQSMLWRGISFPF